MKEKLSQTLGHGLKTVQFSYYPLCAKESVMNHINIYKKKYVLLFCRFRAKIRLFQEHRLLNRKVVTENQVHLDSSGKVSQSITFKDPPIT